MLYIDIDGASEFVQVRTDMSVYMHAVHSSIMNTSDIDIDVKM